MRRSVGVLGVGVGVGVRVCVCVCVCVYVCTHQNCSTTGSRMGWL